MCRHRRAQGAQTVAVAAAAVHQAHGDGGVEQALKPGAWQAGLCHQLVQRARRFQQGFQQTEAHAGQQHLGVHEAGHEFKQLGRTAAHQPA